MFSFAAGAPRVTLEGLTLRESAHGPAIVVEGGALVIDRCNLTSNPHAALRLTSGQVDVVASHFVANGRRGGSRQLATVSADAAVSAAAATMSATSDSSAVARLDGGAIQVHGGDLAVANSTLTGNMAQGDGGAVFMCAARALELTRATTRNCSNVRLLTRVRV